MCIERSKKLSRETAEQDLTKLSKSFKSNLIDMNFNQYRYYATEVNLESEKLPMNFDITYFNLEKPLLILIKSWDPAQFL